MNLSIRSIRIFFLKDCKGYDIMKKIISVLLLLALSLTVSCASKSTVQKENVGVGRKDVLYSGIGSSDPAADTEPLPEKRISVALCGDDIIYQAGFTDAKKRSDGTKEYNFLPNYQYVQSVIESADIAFVNQETLMAGEEYKYSDYPQFNSPRDLLYDLRTVGFDVISIANNHMLDMGTSGLESTIQFYKSFDDITMVGGYESEQDFMTPRIVERNGIKIAFVAFTYSTNGYSVRGDSTTYIPYINDNDIERSIALAKESADMVFVSMHWGVENSFTPSEEQKRVAQLIADCGADLIIGHHPHVIQPVEWLTGENGNKTLCIYSLGDFVAVMQRASNMLGAVVTLDVVQAGGEFTIENPLFNPTVFNFGPSYYNGHVYFLYDFNDDMAKTFGNVYGITADREDLFEIVRDTVDEEFLPEWAKQN